MIPPLTDEQKDGLASHQKEMEERCKRINADFEKREKAKRYQVSEQELKLIEEQELKKKETEKWLKSDLTKKK